MSGVVCFSAFGFLVSAAANQRGRTSGVLMNFLHLRNAIAGHKLALESYVI